MEQERQCLRLGVTVIACAVLLRLLGSTPMQLLTEFLSAPEVSSAILFLETGRVVRTGQTVQPEETTAPVQQTQTLTFQEADAQLVQVNAVCNYPLNVEDMLLSPLSWELSQQEPTVLILHSHATEAYTQTAQQTYQESSAYRTVDRQHNVVRVGEFLAQHLRAGGIQVIHDTTLHDHPDYSGSYSHARSVTKAYLEKYPSICLVIDLHRDATDLDSPRQLTTQAVVNGEESAQLMLVVGTDASGNNHPNWRENMSLAVKLHTLLEKDNPGICRPISFRTQRFNQDLSPGALIIEVGAAGDTLEEALVAARELAKGILALSAGVTADSTS